MRILHTSDWHLGRSFHGVGMLGAQEAFLDHLVTTVIAERVDLVVVAGDVYDRALPPVDAVALADDALARLSAHARVVVSSGNHDSATRLGVNARLVDAAGVHLRTRPSDVGAPVLVEDRHGVVAVHALPYLHPDTVRRDWSLPDRSHQGAMREAMRRVRGDLDARGPGVRSVVMAHAFVVGGSASDSERDIAVGGVSSVSLDLFDDISYTALGHLHGRQRLAETVRYSGSPLAYSFSESSHLKGSWLVELGADAVESTEFIASPVPRPLGRLVGTLDDLLTSSAYDGDEQSWVQATLTDPERPAAAMERLRRRFPHAIALHYAPSGPRISGVSTVTTGLSDFEIATAFVEQVRGRAADEAESALLREAVESCCDDRELTAEVAGMS